MSNKLYYKLGLEELVEPEVTTPVVELQGSQLEVEQLHHELQEDVSRLDALHADTKTMEEVQMGLEAALKNATVDRNALSFAQKAVQMVDKRWGFGYPTPSMEGDDDMAVVASMEDGVGQRLKDMGKAILEMLKKLWAKLKEWGNKFLQLIGLRKKKIAGDIDQAKALHDQYQALIKEKGDVIRKPGVEWFSHRVIYLGHLSITENGGLPSTVEEFTHQIDTVWKLIRYMATPNWVLELNVLTYLSSSAAVDPKELTARIRSGLNQANFVPMGNRPMGAHNRNGDGSILTLSDMILPGYDVACVEYLPSATYRIPPVFISAINKAKDVDNLLSGWSNNMLPSPMDLYSISKKAESLLETLSRSVATTLDNQNKIIRTVDNFIGSASVKDNQGLVDILNHVVTSYGSACSMTTSAISNYVLKYASSVEHYVKDVLAYYTHLTSVAGKKD